MIAWLHELSGWAIAGIIVACIGAVIVWTFWWTWFEDEL